MSPHRIFALARLEHRSFWREVVGSRGRRNIPGEGLRSARWGRHTGELRAIIAPPAHRPSLRIAGPDATWCPKGSQRVSDRPGYALGRNGRSLRLQEGTPGRLLQELASWVVLQVGVGSQVKGGSPSDECPSRHSWWKAWITSWPCEQGLPWAHGHGSDPRAAFEFRKRDHTRYGHAPYCTEATSGRIAAA